jgi:cystathionine beta-lyase
VRADDWPPALTTPGRPMKKDSLLAHGGRHPRQNHGIVNPPVYHASTVLYPTLAALEQSHVNPYEGVHYGRYGTPTHFALEEAITALEGAQGTVTSCSGLAAIHIALQTFLGQGSHALVADSVYGPTRKLCDGLFAQMGVETTYYDPCIGAGIANLMRPDTRLVFVESPGSLTFEVQDIPAIASVAHRNDAVVVMDNTWATPLFFRALDHGVDVSIHAATKYIVGHADAMLGLIACNERSYRQVRHTARAVGNCAGPDDVYLALRGLRTLGVRLRQHERNALALCEWLSGQAEVQRLLYPALASDPGYAIWKRDFTGASGLFGLVLKRCPKPALAAFLDGLKLFGMGYSWGGYESLLVPTLPEQSRTATRWDTDGISLRIHAGLEDVGDLIADLDEGFERMRRAL